MPSPTSSQKGASPKATTSELPDASTKPVWATGPEQITVELLFGGMYDIDVDIAKRMNVIHELRTSKDMVTVTACSAKDFEDALTFCANDRTCAQPPTPTLERIMSELDPTPIVPAVKRKTPRTSVGRVIPDDSDPEDEPYVPSDSEDEESEEEEEEEIKEEDVGAELEDLRAERKEHGDPSSPTAETSGVAKRLADLQIAKDDEDEEDESYVPSSDSEASDSGDEYSDTDLADIGTAAIKAERDEFKAKEQQATTA